ncbi:MAG: SDR family oxidoreductase [candidate division Zixibacteria bacterium]|nr:SDR family oxidoreductase [candidate division Zixibacteria bacterium]
MISNKPLDGKVALVTGGSRGIGKAVSLRLADMGAQVCVNFFKTRSAAEETLQEVKERGSDGTLIRCNVGNHKTLDRMFDTIKEKYGKLDIFISNAALGRVGDIHKVDDEMWNLAMDVNAKAFLYGAQKAADLMMEGGNIVALSSLGSHRYIPGYSSIGISKATIECLVRYMAVEYHPKKINCNAVSGGFIDTDALKGLPNYEPIYKEAIKRTPSGRLGKPEDIAAVVCFLCTPDSRWVTGQTIIVDGGFSIV